MDYYSRYKHIISHPIEKEKLDEIDETRLTTKQKLFLSDLSDNTVYVVLEQGYGDCFMWIRYITRFLHCNLVLFVHSQFYKKIIPSLHYVLTMCSYNNKFTVTDTIQSEYDHWCFLCDLTMIFGPPVPEQFQNYLKPTDKKSKKWKQILSTLEQNTGRKVIALNLDGMDKTSDYRRVSPKVLQPILDHPDFTFINVNIECPIDHPNVIQIKDLDRQTPFCDTLAIIQHCHTVISIDTSIIHVAGAIGKKSILLLSYDSEWRWGINADTTRWYPSLKIIRKYQDMNRKNTYAFLSKINTELSDSPQQFTIENVMSAETHHCKKKNKCAIAMLTLVIGTDYRRCVERGLETKRKYCAQHGYDFIIGGLDEYDDTRPIAWSKIPFIRKYLGKYDFVFCSDADVVIMNYDLRLEYFLDKYMKPDKNIVLTRDWQNLNTGNWFLRNVPEVFSILAKIWNQTQAINHPWWEQKGFIDVFQSEKEVQVQTQVVDESHEFNAYIHELPGYPIPTSNKYRKGDFLIHFAGTDNMYDLKTQMDAMIDSDSEI